MNKRGGYILTDEKTGETYSDVSLCDLLHLAIQRQMMRKTGCLTILDIKRELDYDILCTGNLDRVVVSRRDPSAVAYVPPPVNPQHKKQKDKKKVVLEVAPDNFRADWMVAEDVEALGVSRQALQLHCHRGTIVRMQHPFHSKRHVYNRQQTLAVIDNMRNKGKRS